MSEPEIKLLPTPNASLSNYGDEPEAWEIRRAAAAAKHGNNGLGAPLPIAIKMLLPSPPDPCSPGSGCLTSDCTSPESSTCGCANPTLTGETSCGHGSGCPSMTTCGPSEIKLLPTPTTKDGNGGSGARSATSTRKSKNYQAGETLSDVAYRWAGYAPRLTSSPGGSLARAPAAPANAPDSSTPRPLCGSRCGASFVRFDPAMSSSKMWGTSSGWRLLQASLLDLCGEPFSGTWPRSGSMCGGIVCPLRPSAPRTSVTGFSPLLLGTPTARDWKGPGYEGQLLPTDLAKLLPTPRASERHTREATIEVAQDRGESLPSAVASLSTGASMSPQSDGGKPSTGLRLNPSFVGWMMGTPRCGECGREWTDPDCQHSVTAFTSTADGSSGTT